MSLPEIVQDEYQHKVMTVVLGAINLMGEPDPGPDVPSLVEYFANIPPEILEGVPAAIRALRGVVGIFREEILLAVSQALEAQDVCGPHRCGGKFVTTGVLRGNWWHCGADGAVCPTCKAKDAEDADS